MNRGAWYAAGAYISWGFLPLYWKALTGVSAGEILAHRVVWALVATVALVAARRDWDWLRGAFGNRRTLLIFVATSLLISINWLVYIWAVNQGHIVEVSLGYFMNPLVSVALGTLFLRERQRPGQLAAIALALGGVLYLTWSYGTLPWIALVLASSFALYGLLRKTAPLESLHGLTLETMLIAPFALLFLVYQEATVGTAFVHAGLGTALLLAGAGVITAVPLLWFAIGARRISLTLLGVLQYISPSLQFLLGVLVYHEALSTQRLVGFCLIWLALIVYSAEGIRFASLASRRLIAQKQVA